MHEPSGFVAARPGDQPPDGPESPMCGLPDAGPVVRIPIAALLPADSPRTTGEDAAHIVALAETDVPLPPILIDAGTMRVIDGMHRLRAAQLNGSERIEARFFHGGADLVFPLAVKLNVAHGLPLSLADRKAAAARILAAHRDWSDRAVATLTGLSARTVATIRARATGPAPGPDSRVGRDGRLRPTDTRQGRRIASEIIAARPEASLREVARVAGISPMTVRDVRERMSRGADPLLSGLGSGGAAGPTAPRGRQYPGVGAEPPGVARPRRNPASILLNLKKDPALRLNQHGRELLRWLEVRARGPAGWQRIVPAIPDHTVFMMMELAKTCANDWSEFARYLEQRTRHMEHPQ